MTATHAVMWDIVKKTLRRRSGQSEPERQPGLQVERPSTVTELVPKPLLPKVSAMGDRAEEAVDALSENLEDWFAVDFNCLLTSWDRVNRHPQDKDAVDELFRASHNLAGAETLYKQPEVSRLCRSLVKLVKRGKLRSDQALMELHIDACRAISAGKHEDLESQKVCEALEAEVTKLIAA